MRSLTLRDVLRELSSFILFFLTVGFVVSCCMMLFLNVLSSTVGLEFTHENITSAAEITFINVLIITVIFKTIDYIRRKIMVDKPVKMIVGTAEKIMKGDFSARVDRMSGAGLEGFNQVGETINAMAAELAGVETLRSDFIANVSHEMKTPLATIQNYGRLLQSPDLTEEKRIEYAESITAATRRLSNMMTNILKLNRLENQQIYPKLESFDLGDQICECMLGYEHVWEKKNIEIYTDIEDDVKIVADAELLSLVWNNLFSNAFKFTNEGGKVALALSTDDTFAYVKITDTGCGMNAEVGAHIFEKFYQGDTSRSTQGNGLGLALVKRVVDILKADISVESALGIGTTVTVKIRK